MRTFTYTIKDKLGIHARPAGMFAKTVKSLDSEIKITKDNKTIEANKIMALMGLGIKFGDTITITIDGGNEEISEKAVKEFLQNNL